LKVVAWSLLRDVTEDASLEPARAEDRTAWILLGDLRDALFEAGCIERLLARGSKPDLLLGAGVAAVNAAFASTASATAFERAWESLRGRRFLAAAAVPDHDILAGWLRTRDVVQAAVRHALGRIECAVPLLLASGTRFIEADVQDTALLAREVTSAIARDELGSAHVASAVREAITHGAQRILLFGAAADDIDTGPARAALDEAEGFGIAVETVVTERREGPSLLELLLPGSGGAERAMAAGSRAADTVYEAVAREGGSGVPELQERSSRLDERLLARR
jgi:hypothetical protein